MFSPAKAIIAGALVALGGLFLVAQPFDQQERAMPAAQMTDLVGVSASVSQACDDIFASPIVCTWTASDPRLSGTLTHEWVADIGEEPGIGWAPARLEGPEGSWAGHLYVVWTEPPRLFAFLSGDGTYAGWQYVASTIDDGEEMGDSEWTGATYEGELPPFGPPSAPTDD